MKKVLSLLLIASVAQGSLFGYRHLDNLSNDSKIKRICTGDRHAWFDKGEACDALENIFHSYDETFRNSLLTRIMLMRHFGDMDVQSVEKTWNELKCMMNASISNDIEKIKYPLTDILSNQSDIAKEKEFLVLLAQKMFAEKSAALELEIQQLTKK